MLNTGFIAERYKKNCPKAWNAVDIKIYKNVDRFWDYKMIYLEQISALGFYSGEIQQPRPSNGAIMDKLVEWLFQDKTGTPFFFVEKPLLEAACFSDVNFSIDWFDMHLPFASFNFVLPKNGLKIDNDDVAVLTVTRFSVDELHSALKALNFPEPVEMTSLSVFQISVLTTQGNRFIKTLTTKYEPQKNYETLPDSIPIGQTEKEFMSKLPSIVFNLLFVMAARPEYVEAGQRIGRHKKSESEIWTPNIIGRKYPTKRDANPEKGTHASPRMHWRRGHFRQQAIGTGKMNHKIIWIEPMLISAKKAMEANA